MMKKILKYAFFLVVVVLIGACTKEKKYERWLEKGIGEWQVTYYNSKWYDHDTLREDMTFDAHMKYIFDEKGSYYMVSYNDEQQTVVGYEKAGTWSNSKDVLYLETDGKVTEAKLLEMDKKKMKWEYWVVNSWEEKYLITLSFEKID